MAKPSSNFLQSPHKHRLIHLLNLMGIDRELTKSLEQFVIAVASLRNAEGIGVRAALLATAYLGVTSLLKAPGDPRPKLVSLFGNANSVIAQICSRKVVLNDDAVGFLSTSNGKSDLYGNVYRALSNDEYIEQSRRLFLQRLERNSVIPKKFFGEKEVLDAGCGVGKFTTQIAHAGARKVVGRDLSPGAINVARTMAIEQGLEGKIDYGIGSVLSLEFAKGSFDVVWCNSVAHVTGDLPTTLHELSRVLRPGGYLFLYVNGNFGLYQQLIEALHSASAGISDEFLSHYFRCLSLSSGATSRAVATLCIPYQFTPRANLERYLRDSGFDEFYFFTRGADGDFIELAREDIFGRLKYGEAELRVLCKKAT